MNVINVGQGPSQKERKIVSPLPSLVQFIDQSGLHTADLAMSRKVIGNAEEHNVCPEAVGKSKGVEREGSSYDNFMGPLDCSVERELAMSEAEASPRMYHW